MPKPSAIKPASKDTTGNATKGAPFISISVTICVLTSLIIVGLVVAILFGSDSHGDDRHIIGIAKKNANQIQSQQQQRHQANTFNSRKAAAASVLDGRPKPPVGLPLIISNSRREGGGRVNAGAQAREAAKQAAAYENAENGNDHGDHQSHHAAAEGGEAAANSNAPPAVDRLRVKMLRHEAEKNFDASVYERRRNAAGPPLEKRPKRGFHHPQDAPRFPDEEAFYHWPKSQGGELHFPNNTADDPVDWDDETLAAAQALYSCFKKFDLDEFANDTIPVYATMCVGVDCGYIPTMIVNLKVAIGHFLVVLSDNTNSFVRMFSVLMEAFPGRFTVFHRPQKLSCAESWNLVTRMGFSIRSPQPIDEPAQPVLGEEPEHPAPKTAVQMIPFIFIANADWYPIPAGGVQHQMPRFAVWCRRHLMHVVNRYMHFSSFALTKRGYLELGYFDEVIFPALAEDVEFHLKAVSKQRWRRESGHERFGDASDDLGKLGLYDHWNAGSKHVHRGSSKEKTISKRHGQVARFNYIMQKWGVSVPGGPRDFALAHPFKHPFNIPHIHHNHSWVVDLEHRKCAVTGEGTKFVNSARCWYNATVLRALLPEEIRDTYRFDGRLTTKRDNFPGPYF